MIWLYRLQQRLAITRSEGVAILTLAGLLLLGLAVRQVQPPPAPSDPSTYAEVETRFRAHVTGLPGANRATSTPDRVSTDSSKSEATGRIHLNRASGAELRQLPGIGPALSARIEAYREAHGPFQQVEHLTRVRGIGEKTLARLAPLIDLEDTP